MSIEWFEIEQNVKNYNAYIFRARHFAKGFESRWTKVIVLSNNSNYIYEYTLHI